MRALKLVDPLSGKAFSDFELFWANYPKHRAELDAEKAWRQVRDQLPEIDELIAILDTQAQSSDWVRDGGAYIPYPASYLRQGRWMDED